MKVRTLSPFTDKYTNEIRRTGDVFDCTEERIAEIESVGHFVEVIPDRETQELLEADPDYQRLSAMSATDLRVYADQHFKLTFHENVRKDEMIAAIMELEKG